MSRIASLRGTKKPFTCSVHHFFDKEATKANIFVSDIDNCESHAKRESFQNCVGHAKSTPTLPEIPERVTLAIKPNELLINGSSGISYISGFPTFVNGVLEKISFIIHQERIWPV